MKLYEIDNNIMECIDYETGEILDVEKLVNLQIERTKKIEGIGCYYKNINSEIKALKTEVDSLNKRKKIKENIAENLKIYLTETLSGEKFETSKIKISWRKSEKLQIVDGMCIPEEFVHERTQMYYNKEELKKHVKEFGGKIGGIELLEFNNIQIK